MMLNVSILEHRWDTFINGKEIHVLKF
jgi:hypothetical protein